MKKILLAKLKNLVRGDDGAALVITLGVFFFMYIFCAGVYAIGFAVKENIHLQNACDAAAYSAAVVQADTISRIATLNRVLGWTYAQMCKREMDYIVYAWLDHSLQHYSSDRDLANAWKRLGDLHSACSGFTTINVNGHPEYESVVANALANMSGELRRESASSFYAVKKYDISGLEQQIAADKETIRTINEAFSDFIANLPLRVEDAAESILKANLPSYLSSCVKVLVRQGDPYRYIGNMTDENILLGWGTDVSDFGPGKDSWYVFDNSGGGINRRFNWNCGILRTSWSWWSYYCRQVGLYHTKFYHAWRCNHGLQPDGCSSGEVHPSVETPFVHYAACFADSGDIINSNGYSTYKGKRNLKGYYYVGEPAYPRNIQSNYFGRTGTITVGLAKQNTNPFFSVFRSAMETGFYSAFRPYNDWTWCFSSAKAGYKLYELPEEESAVGADTMGWEARHNGRPRAFRGLRDYCIDWKPIRSFRSNLVKGFRDVYNGKGEVIGRVEKYLSVRTESEARRYEQSGWHLQRDAAGKLVRQPGWTYWRQSWNLTQSDWDAVLLPVRQGGSEAVEDKTHTHLAWMESVRDRKKLYSYEPVWKNRNDSFLGDLVGDANNWKDLDGSVAVNDRFGDMFAGGAHDPDPNGDWGENFIEKTSAGWNGWWDIPKTAADHPEDQREKVQCRWNIGTPHGKLNWKEVTKLMFH